MWSCLSGWRKARAEKALHELLSVSGRQNPGGPPGAPIRGEDLLGTLEESGTEGDHLRHAWLAITAR